jgi:hypothetical protein
MSNPFDKFDDPENTPSAQALPQAGMSTAEQAPPPNNDFNAFDEGGEGAPPPMNFDQFTKATYDRIRRGDSPDDIIEWSKTTPFTITDTMDFRQNFVNRDNAERRGIDNYALGRIVEPSKVPAPAMSNLQTAGMIARRAANVPLFSIGDEIASGVAALGQEGNWYENYQDNHRQLAEQADLEETVNPGGALASDIAGTGISMVTPAAVFDKVLRTIATRKGADVAAKTSTKAIVGGGTGTAAGAVAATGEGTPQDRFQYTADGAAIGLGLGVAFPLTFAAFNRLSRPIRELLSPDSEKALLERTALTPKELEAVEAELQRQADLGLEPSLFDALPERARRVIGEAGRRDGARETMQEFTDSRVQQLPERVGRIADEEMRPAGVTRSDEEMQLDLASRRNTAMGEALDPIRTTPLPITDDIMGVLSTNSGQRAIQNIIDNEPNAARRQAYMELMDQAKKYGQGIDPRLSEEAQQRALNDLREGTNFDLDMSERIGRELNRMGSNADGFPGMRQMGREVRSAAEVSPAYNEAMTDYRAASEAIDAVSVGSGRRNMMDDNGRIVRLDDEGRGFLSEDAERFQRRFNDLLDTPEMKNATKDIPMKGSMRFDERWGDEVRATYTSPDGESVTATIRLTNNDQTGYVSIIGSPSRWEEDRGKFKRYMKDMMIGFKKEYPSVTNFEGGRITGTKAAASRRWMNERARISEEFEEASERYNLPRSDYRFENQMDSDLRDISDEIRDTGTARNIIDALSDARLFRVYDKATRDIEELGEMSREALSYSDRLRLETAEAFMENIRGNNFISQRVEQGRTDFEDFVSIRNRTNAERAALGEEPSTRQVVPAPATSRTLTQPRVMVQDGERITPQEQARFERETREYNEAAELRNTYDRQYEGMGQPEDFVPSAPSAGNDALMIQELLEDFTVEGDPRVVTDALRGFSQERLQRIRREFLDSGADDDLMELFDDVILNRADPLLNSSRPDARATPQPPRPEPILTPAPSQRDLARLGAAESVKRTAAKDPRAAARVAGQLVNSPQQRQRTATMFGDRAGRIEDRARGELQRVERAQRQTTREGRGTNEDIAGSESMVNVMYNPTNPTPYIRESIRFLSGLGMNQRLAQKLVSDATDPNKARSVLERLEKQGMSAEQARVWLDEFRDAVVKFSVMQEGNPYDE